jgi:hypothetical protein
MTSKKRPYRFNIPWGFNIPWESENEDDFIWESDEESDGYDKQELAKTFMKLFVYNGLISVQEPVNLQQPKTFIHCKTFCDFFEKFLNKYLDYCKENHFIPAPVSKMAKEVEPTLKSYFGGTDPSETQGYLLLKAITKFKTTWKLAPRLKDGGKYTNVYKSDGFGVKIEKDAEGNIPAAKSSSKGICDYKLNRDILGDSSALNSIFNKMKHTMDTIIPNSNLNNRSGLNEPDGSDQSDFSDQSNQMDMIARPEQSSAQPEQSSAQPEQSASHKRKEMSDNLPLAPVPDRKYFEPPLDEEIPDIEILKDMKLWDEHKNKYLETLKKGKQDFPYTWDKFNNKVLEIFRMEVLKSWYRCVPIIACKLGIKENMENALLEKVINCYDQTTEKHTMDLYYQKMREIYALNRRLRRVNIGDNIKDFDIVLEYFAEQMMEEHLSPECRTNDDLEKIDTKVDLLDLMYSFNEWLLHWNSHLTIYADEHFKEIVPLSIPDDADFFREHCLEKHGFRALLKNSQWKIIGIKLKRLQNVVEPQISDIIMKSRIGDIEREFKSGKMEEIQPHQAPFRHLIERQNKKSKMTV